MMENPAELKAGQIYNRVNRDLNEQYERVIDCSRRNPGKATLIAFSAYAGAGLLMAGRFNARSRHSRLVEPVMNALLALAYNPV